MGEASLRSPDFDNGEPQRIGLERDLQAALPAQDAGNSKALVTLCYLDSKVI